MTSKQPARFTSIALQFDLDRNIDAAARDVQAAINAAAGQLPSDLPSLPTYRKTNPAEPSCLWRMTSDTFPSGQFTISRTRSSRRKFPKLKGVGKCISGSRSPPYAWT